MGEGTLSSPYPGSVSGGTTPFPAGAVLGRLYGFKSGSVKKTAPERGVFICERERDHVAERAKSPCKAGYSLSPSLSPSSAVFICRGVRACVRGFSHVAPYPG